MTARDRIAERMQTAVVETGAGRVRLRPPRPTDAAPLHTLVADTLAEGRWFLRHPAELDPSPDALVASLEDPARHAVVVVATAGGARAASSCPLAVLGSIPAASTDRAKTRSSF